MKRYLSTQNEGRNNALIENSKIFLRRCTAWLICTVNLFLILCILETIVGYLTAE